MNNESETDYVSIKIVVGMCEHGNNVKVIRCSRCNNVDTFDRINPREMECLSCKGKIHVMDLVKRFIEDEMFERYIDVPDSVSTSYYRRISKNELSKHYQESFFTG